MTRRTDRMAAAATKRLNRIIGQRARRAREAIGRQAASDRAAVDRLWPAPRLDQMTAFDWIIFPIGSIRPDSMTIGGPPQVEGFSAGLRRV